MKKWSVRPTVYVGTDSLERLCRFEGERVYFVCDPYLEGTDNLNRITGMIKPGNEVSVYTDVIPDPPLEKVAAGVADMQEKRPTVLVAVGGGSAIDTTKAMRYSYERLGGERITCFIAIPTTSGTGSEVTSASVITDRAAKVKHLIIDDALLPDEALLDPALVVSSPPSVTAFSGLDVLTHALEALVGTEATEYTDALADQAIKIVFSDLATCVHNGSDIDARTRMHCASCMGGLAFNAAGLGICHAIAHQVGAHFHVPHGLANSMLLPYVVEANASNCEYARGKYAAVARELGLCGNGLPDNIVVMKLVKEIKALARACKAPATLREFGVSVEDSVSAADTIVQQALKDASYPFNPVAFKAEDLKKVYLNIVK